MIGGKAMLASTSGAARPARLRRAGQTQDVFTIAFDRAAGLVRAYAGGCWTIDETRDYLSALKSFVCECRSAVGRARVLLDRRAVSDQSPAVAELLATANGEIFQPNDRIAILVDSSLAKASLRKRMPHSGTKAFLSIEAAETWLSAF